MKMIGLLIVLLAAEVSLGSSCRNYSPRINDCGLYQCLEETYQCGSSGYPVAYGLEYCDKFSKLNTPASRHFVKGELSTQGLIWRDFTLRCLQDEMVRSLLSNNGKSCNDVSRVGFDSHAMCYTSGPVPICKLGLPDWMVIASTVNWMDSDLKQAGAQIINTLKQCGYQLVSDYNSLNKQLYALSSNDQLTSKNFSFYFTNTKNDFDQNSSEKVRLINELTTITKKLEFLDSLSEESL